MLLIKMSNIEKSFGDNLIFSFPELTVYEGDRIGLIGLNGSGKTTLLKIITGECVPEKGKIERLGTIEYFRQFGTFENTAEKRYLKELKVNEKDDKHQVSGGEQTRLRLAETFSHNSHLLLLDEPTSNLDIDGIQLLKEKLETYPTFILISHDIELLNSFCNRIVEIREQKLWFYTGNYNDYTEQRNLSKLSQQHEYENYTEEKKRLETVFKQKQFKAKTLTKKPKNVSSSEYKMRNYAKLSRSNEGKAKSMERASKAVQSRIDQLEIKNKPEEMPEIHMDFSLTDPPANKVIIKSEELSFSYPDQTIFHKAAFSIPNKSRTAIIGPNGCGKTTLLKLIESQYDLIRIVPKAKIGFLYQEFDNLIPTETIYDTVFKNSIQKPAVARSILSNLLFSEADLAKTVDVLSGGEKIKLSLAKLLVSPINTIIFDEPTNYLDIPSAEALMQVINNYEGTIILVSHDREFINKTATDLLIIKNVQIEAYHGNLQQYESRRTKKEADFSSQITLIELKQMDILHKLHTANAEKKEELEKEYAQLSSELNLLRHNAIESIL